MFAVQVLVEGLLRSPVAECRMETSPIVPELDVPRNILSRLLSRRVSRPVDPLDFQRGIKRFGQALSKHIPVRPTDCRIPSRSRTAANSADV